MKSFSIITDQIAERGWAVFKDFLAEDLIESLAREARQLWNDGIFKQAGVGRRAGFTLRGDIRSDHILWLDEANLTEAQAAYWSEVEKLREELNRALFAGLVGFEAHYAVYTAAAFYKKHVDRFSTNDERVISCSVYLNENWKREDGGELRVYDGAEDETEYTAIYPAAGTVVLMRSDSVYHEVRPAARDRYSITGWFRRRPLSDSPYRLL
jgi:SM-20-related protein